MKLIPVTYFGFTAMDRRFSSPMLPWIVSEIRKRDFSEQLSLGVEDGILQAYNPDFELQFSHKIWQVTRFSQADQDPTTFLYLMRDDHDLQLFCYLFQAKKAPDVLHMLNGTLNPQIKTLFANATAYDFLRFSSKYWHSTFTTHNFFARVLMFNLEELYRDKTLQNTYFLPVDVANEDRTFQQIDSYIIQAHILPNQVLFLNPTKTDFVYETECNGDFVYIVVSFVRKTKNFIKSYTVLGDEKHRKGEVLSEIVQANIPLQNGVVHLIKKPLAVFEKELKLFPYLDISYKISSDPYLSRTYEIGQQIGLNTIFANGNSSTFFVYFAPRNRAWDEPLSQSPGSLSGVLGRHLVVSRSILTMDDLVLLSKDQGVVLTTKNGSVRFKFSKIESHFYVEWRQKQIKVQRPNYVCTDGIVHVVDGVFGDLDEIDENPVEINNNVGNDTFWALLKNTVMNV